MSDVIFQKVGSRMLLYLKSNRDCNLSEIARDMGTSYSHVFNTASELKKMGFLQTSKKGRERIIQLTGKGKRVAELISEIKSLARKKGKTAGGKSSGRKLAGKNYKMVKYRKTVDKVLKQEKREGKLLPKHARVLGRIRNLCLKSRPRDNTGKKLKNEILRDIEKAIEGEK